MALFGLLLAGCALITAGPARASPAGGHVARVSRVAGLIGAARAARKHGQPAQALAHATSALAARPDDPGALRVLVLSLDDLHAAHAALTIANKASEDVLSTQTRRRLRADAATEAVRRARDKRKVMERQYRYKKRSAPLVAALHTLNANRREFPEDSSAYRRTQNDRVFVLRQLERYRAAVSLYKQLTRRSEPRPRYVRRAAADAWLALHEPKRAAAIYKPLIDERAHPNAELLMSYYYALIEAEDYVGAAKVLKRLVGNTPVWRRGADPKSARKPNWQRVEVDQLAVLDAAYRRHMATSETRARRLYRAAPANVGIINDLAQTLRWRGLPEHAAAMTAHAGAYAPRDKQTRVNQAENARDLEHYDRWRALIAPLAETFPNDTIVEKSRAALADRSRASVSGNIEAGHSNGATGNNGSRDITARLRLNSPWSQTGWRAFATQYYRFGSYDGGNAHLYRPGIGGEWRWGRKHASALVSADGYSAAEAGVRLKWSQWLGDRFQYGLTVDTYARETPLRAERAGDGGQLYRGRLRWRQNESDSVSVQGGVLHIDDGNVRGMVSANWQHRLQASAHHLTRATLHADWLTDSRDETPYYNPADAGTVGVDIEHDWITWRHYERRFTQQFEADVGPDFQVGYGAAAGVELRYGHAWRLSRTWSLDYSVGWASHEYDGDRESRVFATAGFSGVF